MLDALLRQTFREFEVVISENASTRATGATGATGAICAKHTGQDARIRYVRQSENIGAEKNFVFVLGVHVVMLSATGSPPRPSLRGPRMPRIIKPSKPR